MAVRNVVLWMNGNKNGIFWKWNSQNACPVLTFFLSAVSYNGDMVFWVDVFFFINFFLHVLFYFKSSESSFLPPFPVPRN